MDVAQDVAVYRFGNWLIERGCLSRDGEELQLELGARTWTYLVTWSNATNDWANQPRGLEVRDREFRRDHEDELFYVLDTGFTVFYGNHEHAFGPGSYLGFSAPLTNGDQSLSQADGDVAVLVVGSCRTVAIVVYHPDDNLGPLLR